MSRCSVVTTGYLGSDHIAGLEALHGEVTVDRRCADLAELVAVVRTSRADAALIIGGTEPLTRTLVSDFRKLRVTLVAVSDVAAERLRLSELGVTAVPDEVPAEELATLLSRPAGAAHQPPPQPPGERLLAALGYQATGEEEPEASPETAPSPQADESAPAPAAERNGHTFPRDLRVRRDESSHGTGEGGSPAEVQGSAAEAPGRRRRRRTREDFVPTNPTGSVQGRRFLPWRTSRRSLLGRKEKVLRRRGRPADGAAVPRPAAGEGPASGITVVWGAHGSPGRTTVAVNLAAELALPGAQVLLVDADTVAASAAAHLGLLEETAGLAQACRQADRGRLDASRLGRTVTAVDVAGGRVHLLTGLPRADRWPELREAGMRQVLHVVQGLYDHVVVDTAASVEQDEELTYDTQAPQRHAATLCALSEADRLLLVGAADAVGFSRTVRAAEELSVQLPAAPAPEVIINKVRATAVGRSPEQQLGEAWSRFGAERAPAAFLPWDPQSCDTALLRGQALAEAAPESALRLAMVRLAGVNLPERRRQLLMGARRPFQRRSSGQATG